MLKYLIKFIKEEHLKYLLTVGLYMNAAGYYALMEDQQSKQADKHEGLGCSSCLMYKNRNRPVWCCTAIEEDDIVNNFIKLDKRIFSDFFGDDLGKGKLVLFEYESFLKSFIAHKDKYRSAYGCVNYLEKTKVEITVKNYGVIIQNVKSTSDNMDVQNSKLVETQNVFTILEKDINGTVERISEINTMVEHLDYEIGKMVDMVSNLSAISEENSASTEETMASIEELTATISQVYEKAQNVDKSADELLREVNVFKTT